MNSFDTNADLHMNPKTNLLEQAEFNYILQDVEKPNLYRQNFKYDEVPKIVFNRRLVPMEMPGEIWIGMVSLPVLWIRKPPRRFVTAAARRMITVIHAVCVGNFVPCAV